MLLRLLLSSGPSAATRARHTWEDGIWMHMNGPKYTGGWGKMNFFPFCRPAREQNALLLRKKTQQHILIFSYVMSKRT